MAAPAPASDREDLAQAIDFVGLALHQAEEELARSLAAAPDQDAWKDHFAACLALMKQGPVAPFAVAPPAPGPATAAAAAPAPAVPAAPNAAQVAATTLDLNIPLALLGVEPMAYLVQTPGGGVLTRVYSSVRCCGYVVGLANLLS
ncbi:hypothetical protein B0T20DRAFT_491233 [Sordaria brevicollis]|uniref:Uncharacterized protein n=1 Tax=Sordaria brevicollis TaxID=83679 RepID=A0AAE0NVF8_SORBR|nr:hypothetical protein B0T20DRAFT_491233 [Sordaria brevicollis]